MESPQMYDLGESVAKHSLSSGKAARQGAGYTRELADLADLGATEVSLDLQAFVDDPHFSDGIFTDIGGGGDGKSAADARATDPAVGGCSSLPYSTGGYLPPAQQDAGDPLPQQQQPGVQVKQEPELSPLYRSRAASGASYPGVNPNNPPYTTVTPATAAAALAAGGAATSSTAASGLLDCASASSSPVASSSKRVDRASDEYRRRRERNNVAVRRSREKAKLRYRDTEERVKFLTRENDGLHKRIDILAKELGVLKNLFANVGVLPEQLHREIAKHLGENFNQRPGAGGAGAAAGGGGL